MKVKIVCIKDYFETTFAQSPKFKKGEMYPAEFKNNNEVILDIDGDFFVENFFIEEDVPRRNFRNCFNDYFVFYDDYLDEQINKLLL